MAFQASTTLPRPSTLPAAPSAEPSSHVQQSYQSRVEESQEWILFSPSRADSSTAKTRTTQTAGLSRVSDIGSFSAAARSDHLGSAAPEEDPTEDGELDGLDDGLHAFTDPPFYPTTTYQSAGPVLPAHDGLGTFPASSGQVQDQLWQHEHFNPKRKHEGHHRRPSSLQRRLDTADDWDAQASEEKRLRIEQWRIGQSQALLDEIEKATRREMRREMARSHGMSRSQPVTVLEDVLGTTPKQSEYFAKAHKDEPENESLWRRLTRKFIRDIIGIDEPLLSVILGESLPPEATTTLLSTLTTLPTIPEAVPESSVDLSPISQDWRDRLLQRIARELGVFVHQISPHPGAFNTYAPASQYAGMPITQPRLATSKSEAAIQSFLPTTVATLHSTITPEFFPTVQDSTHAASWGLDEEQAPTTSTMTKTDTLRREREYWERELDIKMVFRYLKDRFITGSHQQDVQPEGSQPQDAARRAAIIRQHHPLVARTHRSPGRLRRDARLHVRRPSSSCASESVKSSRKASVVRSGSSSRNYWDLGGSVGSGSVMASGGYMGGWGEV